MGASHMSRVVTFIRHCAFGLAVMLTTVGIASAECLPTSAVPAQVRAARIVALGEIHGTMEAQKFAGDLLCTLANDGRAIILGLEIPSTEQPQIDVYVAG